MKKFLPPLILSCLLYLAGCSSNPTSPTASNVTFAMSSQAGTTGGIQFNYKPSVDVKITKVIVTVATPAFTDTLTSNIPNYTWSKDTTYALKEYTGVATGQVWNFNFAGTTVSGNTAYNVTSNYTVP
jgi:hypothetical protein